MIFLKISSTENKRLSELEIELENLKIQTEELKTKLQCFEENKRLRKWKNSEAVEQLTPKTLHNQMWKVQACQDTYTYNTPHAQTDDLQKYLETVKPPFKDTGGAVESVCVNMVSVLNISGFNFENM